MKHTMTKGEQMPKRTVLTEEQLSTMARMAADGISRVEIARALGVSGACVTRRLGAVRSYRGKRANLPSSGEIASESVNVPAVTETQP